MCHFTKKCVFFNLKVEPMSIEIKEVTTKIDLRKFVIFNIAYILAIHITCPDLSTKRWCCSRKKKIRHSRTASRLFSGIQRRKNRRTYCRNYRAWQRRSVEPETRAFRRCRFHRWQRVCWRGRKFCRPRPLAATCVSACGDSMIQVALTFPIRPNHQINRLMRNVHAPTLHQTRYLLRWPCCSRKRRMASFLTVIDKPWHSFSAPTS